MTTEILGFTELSFAQAQKEVTFNQILREIEAKTQRALSDSTTTPPGSPAAGDVYIIPAGATGIWSAKTNQLAHYYGGVWHYYTPIEGWHLWISDLDVLKYFDGSSWDPSGGTVTSVGISMPDIFAVSDSPVTSSGTLAVSLDTQTMNTVWAGPATGADAAPTFRALTADDIPALDYGSGDGTVTSVGISMPDIFTVSDSPVTSSGTLAVTLDTQTMNTVWAGPATGADAAPTFRALVADDIPALDYGSGDGTVTSVGISMPDIFAVSDSPVTSSGTLAVSLDTQTMNTVWAGPATGADAAPTFRALAAADIPDLSGTYAPLTQPYDVGGYYPGKPTASAVICLHVVTRAVGFVTSLTGSQGVALAAATAQTDFDIQKNGSSVGTMRFAGSGTTATFIAASPISLAAGDVLKVVAPASPDSTLSDISFTLAGTRS